MKFHIVEFTKNIDEISGYWKWNNLIRLFNSIGIGLACTVFITSFADARTSTLRELDANENLSSNERDNLELHCSSLLQVILTMIFLFAFTFGFTWISMLLTGM